MSNNINHITSASQSLDLLRVHLKSQLLDRLQTGHPVTDTIIAFVVLSSQETVLYYLCKFKNVLVYRIPWLLKLIWQFIVTKRKVVDPNAAKVITKRATICQITESREINTLFVPILWYLNTLTDMRKEHLVDLKTTKSNSQLVQAIPQNRTAEVQFLDHTILYKIETQMITIYADRDHKRENMVITLSCETPENRDADILEQFAEMCIQKYQEYDRKKEWKQTIFRNSESGWQGKPSKLGNIRKLNTVVLKEEQMPRLIHDLTSFLQGEEWYVSRDVPYTRGYMFYGVPGTGKSSCIKALAGFTKRHIHYLLLSEVKSDSSLYKLLENIDYSGTILVIEDIDCVGTVTHSRETTDVKQESDENAESSQEQSKEPKLTLGGLLNALDGGIIDTHGRILVVTTNRPERLDSALVRPGRIDMRFNFGLCDESQIRGLYYNFFCKIAPDVNTRIAPDLCSPAEITSILIEYKNDIEQAWDQVKQFILDRDPNGITTS